MLKNASATSNKFGDTYQRMTVRGGPNLNRVVSKSSTFLLTSTAPKKMKKSSATFCKSNYAYRRSPDPDLDSVASSSSTFIEVKLLSLHCSQKNRKHC